MYRSCAHDVTPTSHLIRSIARRAAALLPGAARARLAAFRFGYTGGGRHFAFEQLPDEQGRGPAVLVDGRIRLNLTPEFLPDLRFHFVDNGQSRDEIGAFIDAARSIRPDALLFDVGAHRGLFSLVHCALAPDRRALLFEPSASLAADAARLIAMNGFEPRAAVRVCGLGERLERRRIVEDALGFARDAGPAAGADVEFTTLDEEWRRAGEAPAMVKIDVEGAEAAVIRGGAGLLRTARPVLFLELHLDELERRRESTAALLQRLAAIGYRFAEPNGASRSASAVASSLRAIVRLIATPQ